MYTHRSSYRSRSLGPACRISSPSTGHHKPSCLSEWTHSISQDRAINDKQRQIACELTARHCRSRSYSRFPPRFFVSAAWCSAHDRFRGFASSGVPDAPTAPSIVAFAFRGGARAGA